MKALGAVLREVLGLFVDDGALAAMTLVWLAVCWGLLPRLVGPLGCAVLLFAGLAAALAVSVVRA